MYVQFCRRTKTQLAQVALETTLSRVCLEMRGEIRFNRESSRTNGALEAFLVTVKTEVMAIQIGPLSKRLLTDRALVSLLTNVYSLVVGQITSQLKTTRAHTAAEWELVQVRDRVALQTDQRGHTLQAHRTHILAAGIGKIVSINITGYIYNIG